jgi:hypothetical protein
MSLFESKLRKWTATAKIVTPSKSLLGISITNFLGETKRITLETANQMIAYGLIEIDTLQNITNEECEEKLFIPDKIIIDQELSDQELFLKIDRMINRSLDGFTRSAILKATSEYDREEEKRRHEVLSILNIN